MKAFDSKASSLPGLSVLIVAATLTGVGCTGNRGEFDEDRRAPPLTSGVEIVASGCEESFRCSRDLKQVLRQRCDGAEEVFAECGPGLGCGNGVCVDACKSAELSKGSIGCSFATLPPDENEHRALQGSCFAAMIANVWDSQVTLRATLGDDPIDVAPSIYYAEMNDGEIHYTHVDGAIAPGKVALVFLADASLDNEQFVGCPPEIVPALRADPIRHKTVRTRAFQLTTDAPVSAYSIWPYGGARACVTASTLLLPVSSWDKSYSAVSTWTTPRGSVSWPFIQIVAAEDDTEVRIRPNVNIVGGEGVLGAPQGQTQSWTLARGEVLQITQAHDTSGSPIEASKPVGLFGGSECTYLFTSYCDVTQQQIPPIAQWGSAYALVPYRPRTDLGIGPTAARETVPWRIVGVANGTKLAYDPAPPLGAPEALEAGEVVSFMGKDLVSVRSQDAEHPFYVAMFMTSSQTRGIRDSLGDPEMVNVVPSEQFLDRYIFFTDHTYSDTTLTFVRRKTTAGFHPVTLECAGEISDWMPLGKGGEYEFAWVYLTKRGRPQTFPAGTCGYGRHEAHSDGPFAVYVWGMAMNVSYGYAAGQGSRPLNRGKGPAVY